MFERMPFRAVVLTTPGSPINALTPLFATDVAAMSPHRTRRAATRAAAAMQRNWFRADGALVLDVRSGEAWRPEALKGRREEEQVPAEALPARTVERMAVYRDVNGL